MGNRKFSLLLKMMLVPALIVVGVLSACGKENNGGMGSNLYEASRGYVRLTGENAKPYTNLYNEDRRIADHIEHKAEELLGVHSAVALVKNNEALVAIKLEGGVNAEETENRVKNYIQLYYPPFDVFVTSDTNKYKQLENRKLSPSNQSISGIAGKSDTRGAKYYQINGKETKIYDSRLQSEKSKADSGKFNVYSNINQGFYGPQYYKGEQRVATELKRQVERIPGVGEATIIYRDYQVVAGLDIEKGANPGPVKRKVRQTLEQNGFNVHITTNQEVHSRIKKVYSMINGAIPGERITDLNREILDIIRDIGPSFTNPLK